MTGNKADAADLAQEVFLQLYKNGNILKFDWRSKFVTWLHRLAVNVVFMVLRKKKLKPEVSLEDALAPQNEGDRPKEIRTRDKVLQGSIYRVDLERLMKMLPAGYRMVFILHEIEGYEHNEIAELLGCSIGNSKSQLHKARMKLCDLLKLSRAELVTAVAESKKRSRSRAASAK